MNTDERRSFWLLCIIQLWVLSGFFSIFQFPLYVKYLGGGEREIGGLMGSMAIASALGAPWIIQAVSSFEQRRMMQLGTLLLSVSTYGLLLAGGIGFPMLLLMLLRGLGFSLFINASGAYLAALMPADQRARLIGINFGFNQVAIGLGPLVAEWVIERLGFPAYFLHAALLPLAGAALLFRLPASRPAHPRALHWLHDALHFGRSLFGVRLRRTFSCLLLLAGGLGAIFSFTTPYAREIGTSSSLFFIFYAVCNAACRFWGAGLADHWPRAIVGAVFLALMALGVLGLSIPAGALGLILCAAVVGVGFGMANPAVLALMLDRSAPGEQSQAVGVFHFAFQLGSLIAVPLLGLAAEHWGYGIMWSLAAAVLAASAAIIAFSRTMPVAEAEKIHGRAI